ncbi:MAG: 2-oxoglutarate dehydrogenase complex dihydrolipoyllysine-residue succinyltransferase [Paracoccaceae bacterium]|nr:2-oxoglutarate dehydrogenase complex dihydrolipoyllysine-residue succinyltransferase [Paracoccaceae bacterium]
MTEIRVPTLGESVTEATVATWFKSPGDTIAMDEMLCELETDKVTVEVPATAEGVLSEIIAKEGDTVGLDAILAIISEEGKQNSKGIKVEEKVNAPSKKPNDKPATPADIEHAPSAKKLMKENDIDASSISGTGRDGRVMKEDVQANLSITSAEPKSPNQSQTNIPSSKVDSVIEEEQQERIKMTRLRQTIAKRLKEAQNTAAMLTTYNEVDMSSVMEIRNKYKIDFEKKHSVKLGFMSFFVKACCHALYEVPEVNAQIEGDELVFNKFVNMGVAVGTPTGLVVPILKHAEKMGFAKVEKSISALGQKARDGKLSMADMQGGTFTISNGGVYGSLMSSPILNYPQSGILGMHKIQERPIAIKGEVIIKPMMYLALSYDHRIVDGKGAVTFLVRVKDALEDPHRLLMDI